MDVSTSIQDGIAVISLKGRFDFSVTQAFRDAVENALANTAAKEIQIDLGGVGHLDSAALGVLLLSRDNAQDAGKTVSLAGVTGKVKQVLNLANFDKIFIYK